MLCGRKHQSSGKGVKKLLSYIELQGDGKWIAAVQAFELTPEGMGKKVWKLLLFEINDLVPGHRSQTYLTHSFSRLHSTFFTLIHFIFFSVIKIVFFLKRGEGGGIFSLPSKKQVRFLKRFGNLFIYFIFFDNRSQRLTDVIR